MRRFTLPEKLYLAAGILMLGGVAAVFSIVFAGAGALLLVLASVALLAGMILQLSESLLGRFHPAARTVRSGTQEVSGAVGTR